MGNFLAQCDESSAEWPESSDESSAESVPIFEVAYRDNWWWSMPEDLSMQLYEKFKAGDDATYTWEHREYVLDFAAMEQRNIANDRRRSLRLIWLSREEVAPPWTGQIPK